ncbi:hypothetical protein E1B28_010446 [Marasmius oreades]|uniref:DUF6533 domain-containing protein n=1 Tax=Marasmius oreades TaxID=181124 RepID=A0A9P7RXA0_9AGAR|nr:uncharacterized protein E1B28_010446 [Marasmius oreades]KAG7091409.1 hypothetical protein E1B28_010446 [Marasmius oreades]
MAEIPPGVDLLETLEHETLVYYVVVAGGVLFVYDILINLDIEIECIWGTLDLRKRKRGFVIFNLLYLAQRYLPLLDQVILDQYILLGATNSRKCEIGFTLSAWCSVVGVLLSELILVLRIWGVWAMKPSIAVILVALALGCSVPTVIFFERFLKGLQYPELDMPGLVQLRRCLILVRNKDVYVCWILLMIIDGAGFILMAIPGVKAYRSGGNSNLIRAVYRDGVIYYALIFMVSLVNVIIILLLPPELVIIISPFERVLHSILASRVILHIRRVALQDNIQRDDTFGGMMTTIEFISQDTEMSITSNVLQSTAEPEDQNYGSLTKEDGWVTRA